MRIVLINYGHFAEQQDPHRLLDEFETLTGWAAGLRDAGAEVVVVQGFTRDQRFERDGVVYRFVAGRFAPRLSRWRVPRRLHRAVREEAPDAVHLNGLLYFLQVWHLRRTLPATTALVAQHHAEKPERGLLAAVQRHGLSSADGFFFTGIGSAVPWKLLFGARPVYEIAEGSTRFALGDRAEARAVTGMRGDPVCLWVGNLTPNKDPSTVLAGFERVVAELPGARLYMIYRDQELLPSVRRRLADSPALASAVKLLGRTPHDRLQPFLNSADVLLSGSRYEGSGYALIEALACGAVPVVTDIPSFRFLTGNGAIGALWRPGDPDDLRAVIVEVARRPIAGQRVAVRAFFDENLSYEAIGRQAVDAYRRLREARGG
ncbi:MAG: glycosyltransferase family 4 protein [Thermoanaerobaculia bacterium]